MKHQLSTPLILQSDSDCEFMIAEHIEIFCSYDNQQITYYGAVYNYELGNAELISDEGRWIYDATLNGRINNKDD